ncbi:MAG: enoyl-CoA hydratase/isomerase family protein [Clostridia bacterium]
MNGMDEKAAATVLVEPGRVTTVRLNRPGARNALNTPTVTRLLHVFQDLAADPAVAVIRLTASGERAFSAGADLREVEALGDVAAVRGYFGGMADLLNAMFACPKPIVAAVFGYTLAGGMGLAAGADLLLAADDAVFGLPEIGVGLFPMVVMSAISRHIGRRRTLELAFTGDRIDAATAERWGFVNRVVPKADLDQASQALCARLSEKSGLIMALGKEAFGQMADLPYPAQLRYLKDMVSLVALSDDSKEGIRAFWEKRPPVWPSAGRMPPPGGE